MLCYILIKHIIRYYSLLNIIILYYIILYYILIKFIIVIYLYCIICDLLKFTI